MSRSCVLTNSRHFFHAIGREKERKRKGKRRKGKEKRREKKRGRKEGNPIHFSIPPIDSIRTNGAVLAGAANLGPSLQIASCMTNDGNLALSDEIPCCNGGRQSAGVADPYGEVLRIEIWCQKSALRDVVSQARSKPLLRRVNDRSANAMQPSLLCFS